MRRIDKVILLGLGVALTSAVTFAFIQRYRIRKSLSDFKKSIIKIAEDEYKAWGGGLIKEGDSRTMDRLRSYWKDGANITDWSDQRMINEPWSSAFISWVMKKGGAGEQFPKTASHSRYIRLAVRNRKQNNSNLFKAYKVDEPEAKVERGDLVCYARQSGVDYDTTTSYQSHCDLVTNIVSGNAITIGGNVKDSVSKTIVPLTSDGYIDKTKDKKSFGGYFVVIKNLK